MTKFSRENPSPVYLDLLNQYDLLHKKEQDKIIQFPGRSLYPFIGLIKVLIDSYKASNILDYGAGKGLQYKSIRPKLYRGRIFKSIKHYWGIDITCYDPGYKKFSNFPKNKFDGVISTDVLEHCPKDDMDWILNEMFTKSKKFIFCNIASYPAKTILPNGKNAHITVESSKWWEKKIKKISKTYPKIDYFFIIKKQKKESGQLISNQIITDKIPTITILPENLISAYFVLIKQKIKSFF